MPNRILKESICTSETIAKLSPFEESLFYRLIVNCDDFGRFDARSAIIRGRLFPLVDVTCKALADALAKLSTVGILEIYIVDGREYLQLSAWSKHQQIRASKSKYPPPQDGIRKQLQSDDINFLQEKSNVPVNENVSDNEKRETRSDILPGAAEADSEPPVVSLVLNDGSMYDVSASDVTEWEKLYLAVDVKQELRKMAGWCDANPRKRKTRQGIRKFCAAWLANEQDKPHPNLKGAAKNKSYDIEELERDAFFDLPEEL